MAEDLNSAPAVREPAVEASSSAPKRAGIQTVLVGRFRLVYAVLAVLVGAAIGSFLVLSGETETSGPTWSAWEPAGSDSDRTREIARFVSREYRLESAQQIVLVSVTRPPTIQQQPVKYVALSDSGTAEDVSVMNADNTVAYVLCGNPPGQNCSISQGTPTPERGLLLRREALELALYTFKYVDGIDSVVTFLPPRPRERARFALFFQKDDLDSALHQPLDETLAPRQQITPSTLGPLETSTVDRYVGDHVFQYSFGQAGDGSIFLALQPFVP